MPKNLYNELVIQTFITVVSVIVLGFAVATRGNARMLDETPPPVLSDTTTATDSPVFVPVQTFEPIPTETPMPLATVSATPKSLEPIAKPTASLTDWNYPRAELVSAFPNLIMNSADNPKQITDWYREKVKLTGLSTTRYDTTATNDHIYNVLVGTNKTVEIEIIIERLSTTDATNITVVSTSIN